MNSTTYLCSICNKTSEHPADDDTPVCNNADQCGLLFEDEIVVPVKPSAPSKRRIKFALIGESSDYVEGDERPYDVIVSGYTVGVVERGFEPHARIVGETVEVWHAGIDGVGHGTGRTRAEAVVNAYG